MKRSLRETLSEKGGGNAKGAGTKDLPADLGVLADRYSGMNESELMMNLMSETRKRKADGSFDMDSIQNGVSAIMPMLDESQKRKLFEIIDRMKKE